MHRLTVLLCALAMTQNAFTNDFPLPPALADGATMEAIFAEEGFYEGPVWHPASQSLFFTACRPEKIRRIAPDGSVAIWQENNGGHNGMMLRENVTLPSGQVRDCLVAAQVMGHGLMLVPIEPDGSAGEMVTLAHDDKWAQPNDVWWAPNGIIYFTDPNWSDTSKSAVWQIDAEGALAGTASPEKIITDMTITNGVITNADASLLIVSDSNEKLWRSYAIGEDGSLGPQGLFFNPDVEDPLDPDGMAIDTNGDLWVTGRGGVWQVSPTGEPRGFLPTPEFCSNVGIGGGFVFITGRNNVWRIALRD